MTEVNILIELHHLSNVGIEATRNWVWGKHAHLSLLALHGWLTERLWIVGDEDLMKRKRKLREKEEHEKELKKRKPQDWNPTPHYPRTKGGFIPTPEDDYLDYASFIPRRVEKVFETHIPEYVGWAW